MEHDFQVDKQRLKAIFHGFEEQKVLIIGDVMCDAYWWGGVNRISPEAPVQVVDIENKEYRLGGAANVAVNLKRLGAEPMLCSVIGTGQEGETFSRLIKEEGISSEYLVQSEERPTTVKTRVMGDKHQLIRLDNEITAPLVENEQSALLHKVKASVDQADAILFVDYDKGVLSAPLIREVIQMAEQKGIPTIVDPKKKNFFDYQGVTLFKPNINELENGLATDLGEPVDLEILKEAVQNLHNRLNNTIAFITLSEQGVFITNYEEEHHFPAHLRNIYDVSGAGDTVISVAALALASGLELDLVAEMANLAGGLVCEEVGVVPIDKQKLYAECKRSMIYKESEVIDLNNGD